MTPLPRTEERAESRIAFGLGFALILTAAIPTSLVLLQNFPDWNLARVIAIVIGLYAVLLTIGIAGRDSISDLLRSGPPSQAVFLWAASGALFISPALFQGRFNFAVGVSLVLVPLALVVGTEGGISRFLLLCGTLFVATATRIPEPQSYILLGAFSACFLASLSHAHFFLRLSHFRSVAKFGAFIPFGNAVRQAASAGFVTLTLLWLTPDLKPLKSLLLPASRELRRRSPITQNTITEVSMLRQVIYSILLLLVTVAALAFSRWIIDRFQKRREAPLPESVGVPMGTPYAIKRTESRTAPSIPDEPREKIAAKFRQLSQDMERVGAARRPSQTAEEFLQGLITRGDLPQDEISRLTHDFISSRYSDEAVSPTKAAAYATRVDRFLSGLKVMKAKSSGSEENAD
ncbi:hypothetical protein CVU37_10825 [candidate division BRC1 bacterium HGW-BRC1-1]|jgi:hypothetical protein|nr:MAG: hypothetical protein CVU37_10825 [candidate division BRC1 bacterium HGW-BRC1-1]